MQSHHQKVPAPELDRRILGFQEQLAQNGMDGALIMQPVDLFYFSGTMQQGQLYIPAQGAPLLLAKKDRDRARRESALSRVVEMTSPKKAPFLIEEAGLPRPEVLGLEMDVLPANFYFKTQSIFKTSRLADVSHLIRTVRAVKSPFEIQQIKKAARMSERVCLKAKELIEPGKTELALAGELEGHARSLGHQGAIRMRIFGGETFYGHVMAGASAAVASYAPSPTGGMGPSIASSQGAGWAKIEKNSPVLVDLACVWEGYISDMTRIFSIGPLPDPLMRGHEAMLEIKEKLVARAAVGKPVGELYETAKNTAHAMGYGDHFMGAGSSRIRFVGHGVGLDLDEYPFLAAGWDLPLGEHMVVALEPKLVFPGQGVVGVENTYLATASGLKSLNNFPEQVMII